MRQPPTRLLGWVLTVGLGLVAVLSSVTTTPSRAQNIGVGRTSSAFHPDSSYNAETLLRNAANHVREAQWAEAIDLYQRVIEQFGDTVAAVPKSDVAADPTGSSTLFVNSRRFCQAALAALPPDGRAVYRQRVDARAEKLYRDAEARSDLAAARQLVDTFFGSSWGDEGLDLLGDLAFREGRFAEALAAYRALVPDDEGPAVVAYPDPEIDRTRTAAKKSLCRAALGETVPPAAMAGLRSEVREPTESFAGRSGALVDSLEHAIAEDRWVRGPTLETRWPTFAGSGDRNGRAPDKVDVGSFQWRVDLRASSDGRGGEGEEFRGIPNDRRGASSEDLEPGVFPIVVGDLVVVGLEDRVAAYHLNKRPEETKGLDPARELLAWQQLLPSANGGARNGPGGVRSPRTTLTASGDRIIARLGPGGRGGAGGVLYAIRSNREIEGKLLWRKPASEIALPVKRGGAADRAIATYEGTPVADESRIYVAMTEAATETWVYVACLDAETGRVIWVRYLGNASSAFDPMRQVQFGGSIGTRLLTLSNRQVLYQTNMGAVACLDADSGSLRWIATYPTRDSTGGPDTKRGLNPALAVGGLVVAAPDDSNSLFAFDSASGHLVWKTQPIAQLTHVLGAAKGKVFATGDRLYTFDLATGRVLRAWPEAGLGFEGAGRGLLAGDFVYWPTKTEVLVLDQETGGSTNSTIPLFQAFGYGGGNLAVGEGYLVVAQRDRLVVFCQNRRLIDRYRLQITQDPERAWNHFQLARLAEATDQGEEAAEAYRQAAHRARPDDLLDGRPLGDEARARLHRLLLVQAVAASEAKAWDKARALLGEAVTVARTDREKLSARIQRAELEEAAGDPRTCVATLQELLATDALTRLPVPVDTRRKLRADLWIAERLRRLIEVHGRSIYAPQDQEAARLLEQGRRERDLRLLEEVGRSYPVAVVAPEALLALGELSAQANRWADATTAYKRLLFLAETDPQRARALLGLARASEARGDLADARATYLRAIERYGSVELKPVGISGTVASIATVRLDAPGFHQQAETADASTLPLERKWVRRLAADMLPLPVDGPSPAGPLGAIFLSEGSHLHAVDAATGETAWQSDIGHEALWVSHCGELVLVATSLDVKALRVRDGQVAWRYDPRDPARLERRVDPFARPEPNAVGLGVAAPADAGGRLHGFHQSGSRLFLLRGDQALVALDANEGRVEWSFEPPTAPASRGESRINPQVFFGSDTVVAQLGGSHGVLVLDASTGARRGEFARDQDESPWLRAPVPLDEQRVLLVLDPRTVVLFDLVRGVDVWSYRDDSALPRAVAPRVMIDQGLVLVLFGGQELARLDAATGHRIWTRGLAVDDLSESPRSFAFDGARVYCAAPGRLLAIRPEDGGVAWTRPLPPPERGWALDVRGSCLAAFLDRWEGASGPDQALPLLLLRRETGQPVQRLVLNSAAGALTVRLDLPEPLVATHGELWAFRPLGPGR